MTVLRRFYVAMELPVAIWRVESAREKAWGAMRRMLEQDARSHGHRVLDTTMVPAALVESQETMFLAHVLTRAVPCDEDQADMAVMRLSCWCVPEPADT